jgi:hypothetical protein
MQKSTFTIIAVIKVVSWGSYNLCIRNIETGPKLLRTAAP